MMTSAMKWRKVSLVLMVKMTDHEQLFIAMSCQFDFVFKFVKKLHNKVIIEL